MPVMISAKLWKSICEERILLINDFAKGFAHRIFANGIHKWAGKWESQEEESGDHKRKLHLTK